MTLPKELFIVQKFGSHSDCGSRDITYLICQLTLEDHNIKGSSDFIEGSFSLNVTTLPGLVALGIVVVEKMILIYDMTLHDHVFKGFCNFVGDSFS